MSFGALLLTVVLLAIAAVLFAAIYLVVPDHYGALLWIGSIALVLGLLSYLFQSISRDPVVQRALGWGFGAMGFTLLLLTVLIDPAFDMVGRLVGLIIVLVLLVGAIAGATWRVRSLREEATRHSRRAEWDQQPAPNAFDYATGTPGGRLPATSPTSPSPPVPPPGGP